jgi:hypothetical protein
VAVELAPDELIEPDKTGLGLRLGPVAETLLQRPTHWRADDARRQIGESTEVPAMAGKSRVSP